MYKGPLKRAVSQNIGDNPGYQDPVPHYLRCSVSLSEVLPEVLILLVGHIHPTYYPGYDAHPHSMSPSGGS